MKKYTWHWWSCKLYHWPKRWLYQHIGFDSWHTFKYWLCTPSNRQFIRNTPRSYIDRDHRLLHCMFSILCDFIEREYIRTNWDDYVKWVKQSWKIGCNKNHPDYDEYNGVPKHQYQSALVFDKLYKWYNSVNWDDTDDYAKFEKDQNWEAWSERERQFEDVCERNMQLLCRHYQSMWT